MRMRAQVEQGTVGDRNREKCLVLDRAAEQMATPQRQDHNRDVTTLGLKSPPEHSHTCSVAQIKVFFFIISICEGSGKSVFSLFLGPNNHHNYQPSNASWTI